MHIEWSPLLTRVMVDGNYKAEINMNGVQLHEVNSLKDLPDPSEFLSGKDNI